MLGPGWQFEHPQRSSLAHLKLSNEIATYRCGQRKTQMGERGDSLPANVTQRARSYRRCHPPADRPRCAAGQGGSIGAPITT